MKYKNESMAAHVETWKQSGLSKISYCETHQISYSNFCKFCSRHKDVFEQGGFALLKPRMLNQEIKLYLPNGCYFALPSDCSLSTLQKLARIC